MEETIPVRYAFVMMLAIADEQGVVVGTDVAIARRINMPLPEFQDAIGVLSAPDPESNNLEHEGRRIIQSDGERGYQVVSYVKYRGMKSEEDRRGYMRDYMRKYRGDNVNVNKSLHESTKSYSASASASASESEGGVGETKCKRVNECHPATVEVLEFLNEAVGRRYRAVPSNLQLISCRLKEPEVDLEGVKAMILHKVGQWKGTDMDQYLRPQTLFNKSKFDGYYANRMGAVIDRPKKYVPNL